MAISPLPSLRPNPYWVAWSLLFPEVYPETAKGHPLGLLSGQDTPTPFPWPGWETVLAPLSNAQPQAGEMAQPQNTGCFCKGLVFCSSTHTGWFATAYKSSPKVSDTSELCRYLHSCVLNYVQINTRNIIKLIFKKKSINGSFFIRRKLLILAI